MCNVLYGNNNNNRIDVDVGKRVKFSVVCTHVPKHHQIVIKIMTSVTTTAHTDTHLYLKQYLDNRLSLLNNSI